RHALVYEVNNRRVRYLHGREGAAVNGHRRRDSNARRVPPWHPFVRFTDLTPGSIGGSIGGQVCKTTLRGARSQVLRRVTTARVARIADLAPTSVVLQT